jgi:putative heme iron utilization protein
VSAADHARLLVASTNVATLATVDGDGAPWASFVAYAMLPDGSPVLCVSDLAAHGRNLRRDRRASLVIAERDGNDDPLDTARVTLAGAVSPGGEEARAAYRAAIPGAEHYLGFDDFSLWTLAVDAVRWVGGYGRVESVGAADYARADGGDTG